MKKVILLTSCLASLLFINCSDDDSTSSDSGDGLDVAQNAEEDVNIDIATLEGGLSIEGATLKTGTLTPNNLTSFSVEETEQSGFKDVGFEIELNVPENYAGAYLQLLAEDGTTTSENYYDIPGSSYSYKSLSTNTSNNLFSSKKSSNSSAKSLVDEEETATIEVDFDSTVPAGSFCYFLCIYDTEGNISAPQTLCVEVEAWGGNDAVTGNWTFTKAIYTEYGETYTVNVGEEDCEEDSYTQACYDDNGDVISETTVKDCNTEISLTLNINTDGTQSYTNIYEDSRFDYEAFSEDCIEKYDTIKTNYTASGNWAYDEEEKKLTLVDYQITDEETLNGQPYDDGYDEDYDEGVGVGFDMYVIKATSNELVIEYRDTDINYDYDDNTGETTSTEYEYIATYYFTK